MFVRRNITTPKHLLVVHFCGPCLIYIAYYPVCCVTCVAMVTETDITVAAASIPGMGLQEMPHLSQGPGMGAGISPGINSD